MSVSVQELIELFSKRDNDLLKKLGGTEGLAASLKTNLTSGLTNDPRDLELRQQTYGKNEFSEPEPTSWFTFFYDALGDTTVLVLAGAAILSLAIGIYEDPKKGWIEGSSIVMAVLIVAVVTASNDYNKEKQFRVLNSANVDTERVKVIRENNLVEIHPKHLVTGDIIELGAGDNIPADCIYLSGNDVTCNESALTGEADDLPKTNRKNGDVFLLSGSSVSSGNCRALVLCVGPNSNWGLVKSAMEENSEEVNTPLQEKLDVLANQIGYVGIAVAILTFFCMIFMWYLNYRSLVAKGIDFENDPDYIPLPKFVLKAFIMAVTIVVVAVPEGLPLAVTLSLAFSSSKMMKDNNFLRVLSSCETMGSVNTICSDKTGTLTQNKMKVVQAWIQNKVFNDISTSSFEDLTKEFSPESVSLIRDSIAINSTSTIKNEDEVIGNRTEGALLIFLKSTFGGNYDKLRSKFNASCGDRLVTFSSQRKIMSALLTQNDHYKNSGILFTKGASEIVLNKCTHYNDNGKILPLTEDKLNEIKEYITSLARQTLRTIAVAHRPVSPAEYNSDEVIDNGALLENNLILDCIFGIKDPLRPEVKKAIKSCQEAGIFVRMITGDNIETAKAIAKECGILSSSGIAMEGSEFRKLTPAQLDEILPRLQVLARSSPFDKHILVMRLNGHALPSSKSQWEKKNAFIMDKQALDSEGKPITWETHRDLLLPGYRMEWLSNRHPDVNFTNIDVDDENFEDKLDLDYRGEVVGVTGDGTNDAPALRAADVGLAMGITGTHVAKEASDIVILDDNFASIVKSVVWGRSVFDNIRKFLQFQLTVNVVALVITLCSAILPHFEGAGGVHQPPLNAVMMLWVNLIMDTMGALALGTEPPSANVLLKRKPLKRDASLISFKMIRHITIQSIFQLALLLFLMSPSGANAFGVVRNSITHNTIIFNTFVFCQVFNEINSRSIDNNFNVLNNIFKNKIFIAIIIITVIIQYGIVQYGGDFIKTTPLDNSQWINCILLGSLSLTLGAIMRLIPVKNSQKDNAPYNPLLTETIKENKAKNPEESEKKSKNPIKLSLIVWFVLITVLPLIAYQKFEKFLH